MQSSSTHTMLLMHGGLPACGMEHLNATAQCEIYLLSAWDADVTYIHCKYPRTQTFPPLTNIILLSTKALRWIKNNSCLMFASGRKVWVWGYIVISAPIKQHNSCLYSWCACIGVITNNIKSTLHRHTHMYTFVYTIHTHVHTAIHTSMYIHSYIHAYMYMHAHAHMTKQYAVFHSAFLCDILHVYLVRRYYTLSFTNLLEPLSKTFTVLGTTAPS